MKKISTIVLAALLALVMSFALIACGDDSAPPPEKSVVVEKALDSLDEYLDANVRKGVIEYSADTAKKDKKSGSAEFTLNGGDVYYKLGTDAAGTERLLDTSLGLSYIKNNDAWSFTGAVYPPAFIEYALDVVDELRSGEAEAQADDANKYDGIDYDAKKNVLSVNVDVAEKVNRALAPLQEVYDEEGSLKNLIDAYFGEYYSEITELIPTVKLLGKPLTVDKIATYLKNQLKSGAVKDGPFIDYVDGIASGSDIAAKFDAYLEKSGKTDKEIEAAKSRTVKEAIEGALAYINAKLDIGKISAGDFSGITDIIDAIANGTDDEIAAILDEVVDYIVFNEVDTENYADDVDSIVNTVTDLLKAIKIKPIVDGMAGLKIPGMSNAAAKALGIAAPAVKAIIAEQITIKNLGATVELKLKADYSADAVTVTAYASHSYTKQTELVFLSDNDYTASLTLTLKGTSNELESSYEMQFAPYDKTTNPKLHTKAASVMRLDGNVDTGVYIETRMFDGVEVTDIAVAYVDGNGDRHECESACVEFSGSSFVFSADGVKSAITSSLTSGVGVNYVDVQATVKYGAQAGESYDVNVKLYVVADASADSAAQLAANVYSAIAK